LPQSAPQPLNAKGASTMTDILGYKEISNRFEYTFDCPEGVWSAHLDARAWGKQRNILLYFSELDTGKKYALGVFLTGVYPYRPGDGSLNFYSEAQPGEYFELATGQTRTGKTKLVSARKIQAPVSSPEAPNNNVMALDLA
jgi:hypothetical protein